MRVLRPARRIHIRLRGRVLRNSPHPASVRSARPHETAALSQSLVSVGFPLGLRPRPSKRSAFFGGYPTRTVATLGTLGSSARCSGARPLSRSLRRRSRRLRGDTRRNASSPGYRLLALRRVSPRIRRTASSHVAQFGTRPLVPCLTFHKARLSS